MLRSRNDDEKELRQQQILAAGVAEFAERGYAATTMSGIAKRSGLSRTLVNFYFGDKAGVHAAIELKGLDLLASSFQQASDTQTKGIEKLKALTAAYVSFQQQHPGYFEALSRKDNQDATPALQQPAQALGRILINAIEVGVADGSVSHRFSSNTQAVLVFWASVFGCITIAENMRSPIASHWGSSSEELLAGLEVLVLNNFAS